MDGFFVVVACISLLCAITAVLRVRAIGWAVWLWFFVGWITGELAIWCIGLQVVFVAAWVLIAGTDTAGFSWGLSLFLATWVLLAVFLRDAFDAGATFSRSLRMTLGVDFLEQIPLSRRAKITTQVHSKEWQWPFRFKRPADVHCPRYARFTGLGRRG